MRFCMSIEVILTEKMSIDTALRKFRKLVKKEELIEQLYNRREYIKPSKKKKWKREQAVIKRKRQEKIDAKKNKLNGDY